MKTKDGLQLSYALLPTEDASHLYLRKDNSTLKFTENAICDMGETHEKANTKNQHLYLTSDAQIKEGEYGLTKREDGEWILGKITMLGSMVMFEMESSRTPLKDIHVFKIEFTTDPKLIADGVPAIDGNTKAIGICPNCVRNESIGMGCELCDGLPYEVNFLEEFCKRWNEKEQKNLDTRVHLRHCYQGEYEDSCKYGEENCPAKKNAKKEYSYEEFCKIASDYIMELFVKDYQKGSDDEENKEHYYNANIKYWSNKLHQKDNQKVDVEKLFETYFMDLNKKNMYKDNYMNKDKSKRDYIAGYSQALQSNAGGFEEGARAMREIYIKQGKGGNELPLLTIEQTIRDIVIECDMEKYDVNTPGRVQTFERIKLDKDGQPILTFK